MGFKSITTRKTLPTICTNFGIECRQAVICRSLVKGVEIPKKDGRMRLLGIPTVEDRIAQTVVRNRLEAVVEPLFLDSSYGYRPNKSALNAIGAARTACWDSPWVIEFDIVGLFDNIDHELLMEAVSRHAQEKWELLYIARFLKVPMVLPDETKVERCTGTPQGGVISPVLANIFMHYAFDRWMDGWMDGEGAPFLSALQRVRQCSQSFAFSAHAAPRSRPRTLLRRSAYRSVSARRPGGKTSSNTWKSEQQS
ncbi:MAG: reverse transcriptase domain-containing protein [Gordonibacter sp.]